LQGVSNLEQVKTCFKKKTIQKIKNMKRTSDEEKEISSWNGRDRYSPREKTPHVWGPVGQDG
jgi:hypothetical protein